MSASGKARLRRLWATIHLWLGLTLGAVGALLGLSGSLLVYDTEIDALLNPQRYAVGDSAIARPFAVYLEQARLSLEGRARPIGVQLPRGHGPVVVTARARDSAGVQRVYLDPGSARVLDISAGGGFVGWLHRFHGSLTLREFWGRELAGIVGLAMLISALSGIYLWWPGREKWQRSLAFRRGLRLSRNLHYTFGFYASLVLALLSFTGVTLAFPDVARRGRGSVRTGLGISPAWPRYFGGVTGAGHGDARSGRRHRRGAPPRLDARRNRVASGGRRCVPDLDAGTRRPAYPARRQHGGSHRPGVRRRAAERGPGNADRRRYFSRLAIAPAHR